MKMLFKAAAIAATALLGANSASSATFGYQLADHPNGGASANEDYGLVLNGSRFFSFTFGDAYMQYDDVAGTATMYGSVTENTTKGVAGTSYNFQYFLTDLTNLGTGGFIDTAGNAGGTLFGAGAAGANIALGTAAKMSAPYANEYFRFGLDALSDRAHTGYEGTGWVMKGWNDFLFTASLVCDPNDPNAPPCDLPPPPNMTPVPLPAAGWMLIAGIGGLAAFGRRKLS